jgi:UDP-N-acetyl-D-glucosamine dehydrogenase
VSFATKLTNKIERRTAPVGVIGLGYVGLPLVLLFGESRFSVVGFDIDEKKTRSLMDGRSYMRHIGQERLAAAFRGGRMHATSDFSVLAECDAIIVCPT